MYAEYDKWKVSKLGPSPSSVALAKREEFLADPATANEIYAVQTLGKQAAIVRAWTEICDDPSGAIYRQDSYAKIEAVYPDRHAVFVEAYENSYSDMKQKLESLASSPTPDTCFSRIRSEKKKYLHALRNNKLKLLRDHPTDPAITRVGLGPMVSREYLRWAARYLAWADTCDDPVASVVKSELFARLEEVYFGEVKAGVIQSFDKSYDEMKGKIDTAMANSGDPQFCATGALDCGDTFADDKSRYENSLKRLEPAPAASPAERSGPSGESAAAAPTSPAVSDTSATSPAAAPTSPAVSDTSALATSAEDCDLQLPTEAGIVAPASNVPQEFAQFSGMWTGIWDNGSCAILVIKAIDVEGKVTGFYSEAPGGEGFVSQIINGKIRVETQYCIFMVYEMDGQITGGFRGGKLTMEKIENPVAAPTSPAVAVSDTSALATSAADCDFYNPRRTTINIVAPASDVPQEFAQFSGKWTGFWDMEKGEPVCGVLVISKINAGGHFEAYYGMGEKPIVLFRSSVVRGEMKTAYHTYMLSAEMDGRITGEYLSSDDHGRITMEKVENP